MKTYQAFAMTTIAIAVLGGCSTLPPPNARLDRTRSDYQAVQSNPQSRELAGGELRQAGDALTLANDAWAREDKPADVDHLVYLAQQRVAIVKETTDRKIAELVVSNADAARDKVRLAARTNEADAAQQQADAAKRDSAASLRDANAAQVRNAQLEAMLAEMNAKKTERGMVITIGDLLFDTDQAQLKPGGVRDVEKLAGILAQFPQRKALIEGFTDSTGSASHNQDLAGRRAESVRSALVNRGVGRERISLQAYGEEFPVASNDNTAGRQLNRRVEIILSDDSGVIPGR
jgi:outer membrane protein OmpA-like peptidoglycan-associated protein